MSSQIEYVNEMLPHYPVEYDSANKAKACENVVLNQRMPVALKKVMGGNFKTKLCPKPKLGGYKYGNQCYFARDAEASLLNEMQLRGEVYYRKTCEYEDRCRFLHVNAERCAEVSTRFRKSSVISILSGGSSVDNKSGSVQWEYNKGLANSLRLCKC